MLSNKIRHIKCWCKYFAEKGIIVFMLKKDISVVKHALLDGMSTKAVWDSFDRIKKFIEEAQNISTNSKSTQGCVICGCNISLKGYCAGCQTRVD